MYKIVFTKQAIKDLEKLKIAKLSDKTKEFIEIIKINPFQNPPHFEILRGNLQGTFSRRINIQHRLVYQVLKEENTVKILRMWTHYENL